MEIKTILNSLVDLFFPMRCIHCDDVIITSQTLCAYCAGNLSYTHWELDRKNKAFKQLYQNCRVEAAYSLLHFDKRNATQSILHEIKYKNRPELGISLADKIQLDLSNFDGIIPIPLHSKRLKSRGYNQIELFAKQLAINNQLPYLDKLLIRNKFNSSQVFKSKKERINDLKNAFLLTDTTIKGHYIVVDDLLTTGATLSQAVLPFNDLNDVKISVITIACA
ncbi:ComF family protein [Faecalibacter rhinopitheci]|uniref:ComF family protein n=1 Tax=Faecalibacter rhinopitheci TaxID=2779678 RepID=A0A8J7K4K6_9FLAO|nr:ComF family protein [Faecalibacter rhinopitheci]MBF0597709.1 ComF family protein [Faecalibacter rhinopitheci]MBQ0147261.1 ComF family protein [Candidatus Onthonaster equi]